MTRSMKTRRAGMAQQIRFTVLAGLCVAAWCGGSSAAPAVNAIAPSTPATQQPATAGQPAAQAPGAATSGANWRRAAVVGVLAVGAWSIWRAQRADAPPAEQPVASAPPAPAPAVAPQATTGGDPDRPIDMDGIGRVEELDTFSNRQLMDTLRDLRARKAVDCAHGRSAIDYFCSRIRMVIEALDRHGVRNFGDQSHDGCDCR